MANRSHHLRRLPEAFLLLALLLALFFPLTGAAQQEDERVTLRGTVVNSSNGTPIRGALVQLSGEHPRATLTGADGVFEFSGLKPAEVEITARKPGFFTAQELRPNTLSERRVHLVPEMGPVTLQLFPEGVIFGRITGENGEGLEGLTVLLRRLGEKKLRSDESRKLQTTTDETGSFRIAELKPGSYLLVASKSLQSDPILFRMHAVRSSRGYGNYFYPSVTDSAAATPIAITPGKQFKADMRLEKVPYLRVSGRVTGGIGTQPLLVFIVATDAQAPVAMATANPPTGDFLLQGVPPGSYVLGAMAARGQESTGILPLQLTHDLSSIILPLAPNVTLPVNIRKDRSSSEVPPEEGETQLVLSFDRLDLPMGEMSTSAIPQRNDKGVIMGWSANLAPGKYRLNYSLESGYYVASANSGTADLINEDLLIAAGGSAEPIEIVLRDDVASLQGKVVRGGDPAVGRVFLIPTRAPRTASSEPVDSDGNFLFTDLAPGAYLVVALEDEEDADLDNPDTLRKIQSKGEQLDFEPRGRANVTLELKRLEP